MKNPKLPGLGIALVFFVSISPLNGEGVFTREAGGDLAAFPGYFYNMGIGDYDNDGLEDLMVANTLDAPNFLFRNNGDGTFSRVFDPAIESDVPSSGASTLWGDWDNDGDLDLFISNYEATINDNEVGELKKSWPEIYGDLVGIEKDSFYLNNGDGTFTKVTEGAWVNDHGDPFGAGSCWVDYDRDGHLDLYVGNAYNDANFLYRNSGNGEMVPVVATITEGSWESHGSTWTDFNGDGWPDLAIAGQGVVQYLNNGDGTFSPVSRGGIYTDIQDWGVAAGDYDNDGDMDLVISGFNNNQLYNNNGQGLFTAVADGVVDVTDDIQSAGVYWGDYDNDGYLDLLFANPMSDANFLYRNNGDGSFTPVTDEPLVNESGYGWGAAWVDIDNDGDLDLLENDGTIWPFVSDPFPVRLYRNNGNDNHWLQVKLEGVVSNRSAIGATIRIETGPTGEPLKQMREVAAGTGPGSQASLRQHFGLGAAQGVDSLTVEWPSGVRQTQTGIQADQIIVIDEIPWAWPMTDGYSDLSPWMGWFYVQDAPWVWSFDLNKYLYWPWQGLDPAGAWIYFPK